jgi:hypothetical protein
VKLKELRLKKITDDKDELNDVASKKHLPRMGAEKRQVDQTSPIWSTMHAKRESFGVGIRPFAPPCRRSLAVCVKLTERR